MQIAFDQETNTVSVRQDANDAPNLAVEELKKERAKREELERKMALILEKLNIEEV
ncbi:hypothetical protein D3C76_903690 [compost metagenome]